MSTPRHRSPTSPSVFEAPAGSARWSRPGRWEVLAVVLVVLLALVLRVHHLGYKSLWLDELNLLRSSYGGGTLFARFGYSILDHPPGYLIVLRLLMHVGREEWLLRLPALLASVASVISLWAMVRTMLGPIAGILASLVLALLPMHIAYAQEAHSYGVYGLLSVLLLWSLYQAAMVETLDGESRMGEQQQRSIRIWAAFVLISTLALYVHYYSFYLVGLSVLLFPLFMLDCTGDPLTSLWRDRARRRALLRLTVSLLVIAVLYLPQVIVGLGNSIGYANNLATGLAQRSLAESIAWAFRDVQDALQNNPGVAWGVVVTCGLGLLWLLWRRRQLAVGFLLILLLPLVPSIWLAYQTGIGFNARRVIFVLPVLAVAAATGLTAVAGFAGSLWSRLQRDQDQAGKPSGFGRQQATGATAALLAIGVLVAAAGPVRAYYATPKQDWKTLGRVLTAVALPTDAIVAQEKAARNLSWYYPQVEEIDGELVPALQQLCDNHSKVYLAVMPNEPLRGADADWVTEGFVEVPLKDLKLFYRNCSNQANWYGEEGASLFEMAFNPQMPFLPTLQAYDRYQRLADTYDPSATKVTGEEYPGNGTESGRVEPSTGVSDVPSDVGSSDGEDEAASVGNDLVPGPKQQEESVPAESSPEATKPPPTLEGPPTRPVAEDFLKAGYADEALTMFQELILTQPEDRGTHMGLAAALAATGQIDQAFDTYASIEANWPDFPWVFIRRGELWERIGNVPAALDEYQGALGLAGEDPDVYFVLGFAFDRLDRPEEAIAAFQTGLQLDPSREGPRQALEGLLERSKG